VQVKGINATQATVASGSANGILIAINNLRNNVVYIISAVKDNDPFIDYIKNNLAIVDYSKYVR
jgi:hypothetical protein